MMASKPTILDSPVFVLENSLTEGQKSFFHKNGIIQFKNFISRDTVNLFLREIHAIEKKWLDQKIEKINGIPLKFGQDQNGNRMIQRLAFTSLYSDVLREFLQDSRLQSLVELLYPYEGRIGENEKDGLVVNHYVRTPNSNFSQMGWHTDSPRDLFMGQRIMPMLNVGIHLDDCSFENGGLRVLPGTHKQGMLKLLFSKKYFIDHNPDPREVGLNVDAGDLTVHDGRIWHRVHISPHYGEKSRRRVMYIPIITGDYKPKNEHSKTPFYHRFASKVQN
ncbi:phytanoyl-CoA dioxygenase family protein [Cytophagaceae bacterium DM2B3-1]|uniref:Phytanoyl-CoA dioxygenase family protein n=1 Tax=Xanthocytophaga flava TaxID=3048013 RepID=A0AAE3U6W4_9BACT|nr:phytanoyl-CoA dioxygenase family protein [Xanthocytophaga flavus]MDJ1469206.1 phytanoyl-CoA dioxygenase family protein [Xanthocytophaga flavus]MDJ1480992.1 phytanoyl-CoA dioxygenase family protein [Xanthocytophaga flavus]MDJ1497538.1 phytanoyl-CoA dioxygenase family protein [Xanthocytophaga flavus]